MGSPPINRVNFLLRNLENAVLRLAEGENVGPNGPNDLGGGKCRLVTASKPHNLRRRAEEDCSIIEISVLGKDQTISVTCQLPDVQVLAGRQSEFNDVIDFVAKVRQQSAEAWTEIFIYQNFHEAFVITRRSRSAA